MLMIPGPSRADPPSKATPKRRATDGPQPAAVAKAAPPPRAGRRSTDPQVQPAPARPRQNAADGDPHDAAHIGRAYAPVVAQLIGAKLGVAQSRLRRRGSVADATAAYERENAVDPASTIKIDV